MLMAKSQEDSPVGHDQSHGNQRTGNSSTGGDQPVSSIARDFLLRLDTSCIYEDDKQEATEG